MPDQELTRTAADVMTPGPRTCSPFSSVLEAVLIFRDAGCGAVPVVDAGQPVGILTEGDVSQAMANDPESEAATVSDVMTEGAFSVPPDSSIEEVRAKFAEHAVGRLLVVDATGQLLGIIALSDLPAS